MSARLDAVYQAVNSGSSQSISKVLQSICAHVNSGLQEEWTEYFREFATHTHSSASLGQAAKDVRNSIPRLRLEETAAASTAAPKRRLGDPPRSLVRFEVFKRQSQNRIAAALVEPKVQVANQHNLCPRSLCDLQQAPSEPSVPKMREQKTFRVEALTPRSVGEVKDVLVAKLRRS